MDNVNESYTINTRQESGEIAISEDVLTSIAAIAATDVENVTSLEGGLTRATITKASNKKMQRAVKVEVVEDTLLVTLRVVVSMDKNVLSVSKKVQQKVKETLENMTGLEVANVDVNITSIAVN